MDTPELRCCLTLLRLPGIGAAAISELLRSAGSAARALCLDAAELGALGWQAPAIELLAACDGKPDALSLRECERLLAHGVSTIGILEPGYPPALREIASPPPLLFVRGDPARLPEPQVAVVGSRRPTPAAAEFAVELCAQLAGFGLIVTSGLALGIDGAAHTGALRAGAPTIGVMGTGPDQLYPARHRPLAERMLAGGGALVTEFPPGVRAQPHNFPRRNRIISGLSLGVVVVEAGLPSGSLLTAQYAAEQGREVMAVPGSVRNPLARGCHQLLRNGAALVETAEDVLIALGDRFRPAPAAVAAPAATVAAAPADAEERRVLEAVGYERTSIDELVQRSGLGAGAVAAIAVRLELRGLLVGVAGGFARVR